MRPVEQDPQAVAMTALDDSQARRDPAEPGQHDRVFLAIAATGGSNVYWLGQPCHACAYPHMHPLDRHPVPCRHPRRHARQSLTTWGHGQGRMRTVRVDLTLPPAEIAVQARQAEAVRS
ncbi:MAG: hypothetical protein GEV00_23400 [Actinophytocola sp.]|nr:hypothetical protein [Actinophytocola sp.]